MVATASHSVTIVLWKETAFPLITAALCNTASNYIFALWFVSSSSFFFMVALCNTADHYSFALRFLFSFFFPRLISAVGDWMSTILPHMVWQCEFTMHV